MSNLATEDVPIPTSWDWLLVDALFGEPEHLLLQRLSTPHLIQSPEFDRRSESTQTAPSERHAAIEPSHDMKGHRIPKESGIQHPAPFSSNHCADGCDPADAINVGLRPCRPLAAIPVAEVAFPIRVLVPPHPTFMAVHEHSLSVFGESGSDRITTATGENRRRCEYGDVVRSDMTVRPEGI